MITERDVWQEERERVKNIETFKLQVEREKLQEEKEAFQIEKNIHGYATAKGIMDLRVSVDSGRPQKIAVRGRSKESRDGAMMQQHMFTEGQDADMTGDEFYSTKNKSKIPKDKYDIVQEMFDKPIYEAFNSKHGNEMLFKNMQENTLDFKNLLMKHNFKFGGEFRIRRVKELVEVEYG